jgi:Nuclease-related domain
MRIIRLSDHPGEELQAVQHQRQIAQEETLARYEHALAQHRARFAAAMAVRDEARAQRRWLAWLRGVFGVWAEEGRAPRRPIFHPGMTDQEEILSAGMAGEQSVANELGRVLSDDWVLLGGYRNRNGEIDHLLLGPRGLFAMEVKHRNATVHVDGDDWRFDKFDRFGNLVEQGRITDRGGRSPSRQVNDSADELQRFLNRRHQQVAIERIVILTHPRSELGSHRNLTVSVATSMEWVLQLVNGSPSALQPAQLTELQQLIEQDHRFHMTHNGSARNGPRRS